jgi:hypothetical protein
LLAVAEQELQSASNGRALCRITASGAPARDVKFFEGRWAALRALTKAPAEQGDALTLREHAQRLLASWQADLERWSAHEGSSWIPYCEGGVAGLTEFLGEP